VRWLQEKYGEWRFKREQRLRRLIQEEISRKMLVIMPLIEKEARNTDELLKTIQIVASILSGMVDRVVKLEGKKTKKGGKK